MNSPPAPRLALLYPGDRAMRDRSDPAESRFAALFAALAEAGVAAEPAVWHDDFADEVRAQLLRVHGVLVWCNPIEGGRRRDRLDALLREVADAGVLVSAHPDTILRLGTKDVLLHARGLPFGSDVHRVDSVAELRRALRERLPQGPRVLKQHRGHSGIGVWRIEQAPPGADGTERVHLRAAQRGSESRRVDLEAAVQELAPCFEPAHGGHMIDQAFQPAIAAGMVRAYLVGETVAGFGHQAINALFPSVDGEPEVQPGPRLYHPADAPAFQPLRRLLEGGGWIRLLRECTGVAPARLPLLWDIDFIGGQATQGAAQPYVLCEVNVSSVSPFPPSCIAVLVQAVKQRLGGDTA